MIDCYSQNQISSRHIKRIEDDKEKLQDVIEKSAESKKELNSKIKDKDRLLNNLESTVSTVMHLPLV